MSIAVDSTVLSVVLLAVAFYFLARGSEWFVASLHRWEAMCRERAAFSMAASSQEEEAERETPPPLPKKGATPADLPAAIGFFAPEAEPASGLIYPGFAGDEAGDRDPIEEEVNAERVAKIYFAHRKPGE
jgi:hypothetical protein